MHNPMKVFHQVPPTKYVFTRIEDNFVYILCHQPQKQKCGLPCKALWHVLRKNHFIPSDGVPMLNPDWTIRTPKHAATERNGYPEDWIVILGKRYGKRALEQSDTVEALLRRLFTSKRVRIFDGDLGILEGAQSHARVDIV